MITLSIFLALSACLNGVLIWYSRRLAQQFVRFTENVGVLETTLQAFSNHLKDVHELEMFYGDDTLGALIKHSKSIVEEIKTFYDSFSIEPEEEEIDGET
jgi:hypothetical protein